jgi:hypothetical protein
MAGVEASWPAMGAHRRGREGDGEREARLGGCRRGVPWGGAAGARAARGCSVQSARGGLLPVCCAVREEEEGEREKKKKWKEKKKEKKKKSRNFCKLENFWGEK